MSDSEAIGNFPSRAELGKHPAAECGKRPAAEPRGGVSHPATEPDESRSEIRSRKGGSRTQSHRV